jgi:HD-GYP domain-containing protein (c-di-GMP phosphodiesterase class II)
VWDKRDPLTDLERERVRMHAYAGERILARATALEPIAAIATLAHERLDGRGYHRAIAASAVPPAARLLAAADVYHALVEDRAYRPAFSPEAASREIASMRTLCPDAVAAVLAVAGHERVRPERPAGLTEREVDVLRLLARGLTNKEIASALKISTRTAGHHLEHIYQKLGVTTRAAAAMVAMQTGVL